MSSLKLFVGLIVAALVVVFGAQNTQAVTFHFLIFKVPSAPLVLALALAILLGTLLGWIVSVPSFFRNRHQRRDLEKQLAIQSGTAVAVTEGEPATPVLTDVSQPS